MMMDTVGAGDALTPILEEILKEIQGVSRCESVAIRLPRRGDFPYYVHADFHEGFVQKESRLNVIGADGQVVVDAAGGPVVECMCGNVLKRRFNPEFSFFTAKGSFWTNSTTTLLSTMTNREREEVGHTRNTCHHFGYESVALIPFPVTGDARGLIQLNDPRENMFTLSQIHQYEAIADHVGLIVSHMVEATAQMAQFTELISAIKSRDV